MDNVEKMCENIQGKNNNELSDNNISVGNTLLEGTVNKHIHSGGGSGIGSISTGIGFKAFAARWYVYYIDGNWERQCIILGT